MITSSRRRSDETVHEFQHRLLAERRAAWLNYPNRTGADRLQRREYNKRAAWTMTGHLRILHGMARRHSFVGLSWEDLEALHDQAHQQQGEP